MPRTRTADAAAGAARAAVGVTGRAAPLGRAQVDRTVRAVLAGERRRAAISISFVGRDRMQELHDRWKGQARPTDVLAFTLGGPAGLVGDVYVCPWVAAREARALGIPLREELRRLVIHGVLHVLGYDHPDGPGRTRSAMWRRQERYLRSLR